MQTHVLTSFFFFQNQGLYVEIKKPTYFRSLGLSLEEPLLEILTRFGYDMSSIASYVLFDPI